MNFYRFLVSQDRVFSQEKYPVVGTIVPGLLTEREAALRRKGQKAKL